MGDRAAAIPRELLNAPVSDLDIAKIASYLTNWEALSPWLGLTGSQEEEIRNTYWDYAEQKRRVLRKWKQISGDTATYRAFIAAASAISNIELADNVRALLRTKQRTRLSTGLGADNTTDQELTSRNILDVSGYLYNLGKSDVKTLGLLLGLNLITVSNTFEGSSQKIYLDSILEAWFRKQDDVLQKGCPSWRVLVVALEDKQLRQNGIAAEIRRDTHL